MKEKLVIKNFGPIASAEIEIKKMMVFIGDSGSGKSVVLKLLSLFRWIYKKLSIDSEYKFDDCREILRQSGLLDFCVSEEFGLFHSNVFESKAIYCVGESVVEISCKNGGYKLDCSKYKSEGEVIYEKVSFIADDRIILPLVFNQQMRVSKFPYHLEKTYEDFFKATDKSFTNGARINIETMDIWLSQKTEGIRPVYYLENKDGSIRFHNASSGMKSASIIETITSFYAQNYDEAKRQFSDLEFHRKIKQEEITILEDLPERMKKMDAVLKEDKKNEFSAKKMKPILNDMKDTLDKLKIFLKVNVEMQRIENLEYRLSFFIEEPELSLFPTAQKRLVDYLVALTFKKDKNIRMAFSTHSPYILTSLNCLLKAYKLAEEFPSLREKIKKIVDEKYWLNPKEFDAFMVENGEVYSICKEENEGLILAEKIDGVSDEIRDVFDELIDLELEMKD
ncbi:AAA family ATPase [Helicobacter pametensis]|uniref:AAA family ATPase n=1 Tax=Helicobacter pametensis TaxID=95149 RepID=UPI0004844747|nr:AAA family ATPase [Helicobacter pametensis]